MDIRWENVFSELPAPPLFGLAGFSLVCCSLSICLYFLYLYHHRVEGWVIYATLWWLCPEMSLLWMPSAGFGEAKHFRLGLACDVFLPLGHILRQGGQDGGSLRSNATAGFVFTLLKSQRHFPASCGVFWYMILLGVSSLSVAQVACPKTEATLLFVEQTS